MEQVGLDNQPGSGTKPPENQADQVLTAMAAYTEEARKKWCTREELNLHVLADIRT